MSELGYKEGENVEYIFNNAQGDNNTAASIVNDFKGKNPDVVMAIATPVAQAAATLSSDIPVVFAAVSDPVGAKLTSTLEKPFKVWLIEIIVCENATPIFLSIEESLKSLCILLT